MLVDIVDNGLAILTILGDIFVVFSVLLWVFSSKSKQAKEWLNKLFRPIDEKLIFSALIVSIMATAGSLFYSEIAGYDPCKLCWLQRIFMYPQVILLAIAYKKSDIKFSTYSLSLSVPGLAIAVYHYIIQFFQTKIVPCSTVGYSVSCSEHFTLSYGYITIPMMAATAFMLMIVFMIRLRSKSES
ncbi:MAG: disulfide bond formation protein B [Candidatus Paceibacteria bacterium]